MVVGSLRRVSGFLSRLSDSLLRRGGPTPCADGLTPCAGQPAPLLTLNRSLEKGMEGIIKLLVSSNSDFTSLYIITFFY